MYDLVGIGSINVDLIVDATTARRVDLADPRLGLTPSDAGNEVEVDIERIRNAVGYLSQFEPVVSPGGSALNVTAGVAATGAPLRVGYVGVLGVDDPTDAGLAPWLAGLGVDTDLIDARDGPPGLCLSINRDGERTLLTTGGVNDRLDRFLTDRRADIAAALGRTRLVHITSLAGLDDLTPLVDVLDEVQPDTGTGAESGPRLSCDPGAIWTSSSRATTAEPVLARCHQVLVNRREFALLGRGRPDPDVVFDRLPLAELVVVKAPDAVEVHHRSPDGRAEVEVHTNPRVLGPDEIVDDTGSGDAFAAGFLVGQLTGLNRATAVDLGMDLARIKMGFPGVTGIERYRSAYRRLVGG